MAYRQGLDEFRDGRLDDAAVRFAHVADNASGTLELAALNMVGQIARLKAAQAVALDAFARMEARASQAMGGTLEAHVARYVSILGQLAGIYQAEIFEAQGRWVEARSTYERLLDGPAASARLATPSLIHHPDRYERLARLHWRTGQHDEAEAWFRRLLVRWPDAPRAPLISCALLALEQEANRIHPSKYAFLCSPLGAWPDLPAADGPSIDEGSGSGVLSRLALERMSRLVAKTGAASPWRTSLRFRYGWMLFEAGRTSEADAEFRAVREAEASNPQASEKVGPYVDLSRAIVAGRQGRLTAGEALAQAVTAKAHEGHVHELAQSILASFNERREQVRKVEPCGIESLK